MAGILNSFIDGVNLVMADGYSCLHAVLARPFHDMFKSRMVSWWFKSEEFWVPTVF